jgi:hypothetical protein
MKYNSFRLKAVLLVLLVISGIVITYSLDKKINALFVFLSFSVIATILFLIRKK